MNMYRKEEQEDEMGGQEEHMEGNESEGVWGHHGWDDWGMKKCGCPMCHMILTMKKISMTRGMGPDGCEKPSMRMGSMPWRKFMSSDEKIAKLEAYLKKLQAEEKAVEEKIEYIKKEKA